MSQRTESSTNRDISFCFCAFFAALFFAGPVFADQPSDTDPSRFLGVKRWVGTVDVEYVQIDEYLNECGKDSDPWGKWHDYGKAWEKGKITGNLHLNVDIPFNELKPSDEQSEEDKKTEAEEKKLEAMAKRFEALSGESIDSAGTDTSEDQIRFWGYNYDESRPPLGEGEIRWNRTEDHSCPNGSRKVRSSGSAPAKKVTVLLSVAVGKDWQDYSLSVESSDKVPGDMIATDKWQQHDTYCKAPPETLCTAPYWHWDPFWTTAVDRITKNGVRTYSYKSTSRQASGENKQSSHTESGKMPQYGPGMGGHSAGLSFVDISKDKKYEPFGPAPEFSDTDLMNVQARDADMARYKEDMKKYRLKVWPSLPKSGMVLQGETVWSEVENEAEHKFERTSKIKWNLAPYGKSEYEVEVEIDKYKDWRPKGHKDPKTRGNTIAIRAKLIDPKTGKTPDAKADKFVIELRGTSKIKGVAMNWPSERTAKEDYDLKFEYGEDANPEKDFLIENEGQTISTRENKMFEGATFKLSSFDWGGYTDLYVRAIMPGGSSAEGHLKGAQGRQMIPIPKRTGDSKIADGWKANTPGASGKDDAADDENKPENHMATCAAHKGDGLTLFDEYRGFYSRRDYQSDDGHIQGDPQKKDYFVVDSTGESQLAIYRFGKISGMNVHGWLMIDEVKDYKNPVINFNKGGVKNDVEQHAVELVRSQFSEFVSEATSRSGFERPGTPGTLPLVTIGKSITWEDMMRTVPHELGHASSIFHHGELDPGYVYWVKGQRSGKDVILEVHSASKEAALVDSRTRGLVINAIAEPDGFPMEPDRFNKPRKLWLAHQHGQHSGDEACVMRYALANAYKPSESVTSTKRVFKEITAPPEKSGYTFCEVSDGTGDAGRRYGNADTNNERGACKFQICVNDKYMYSHQGRK